LWVRKRAGWLPEFAQMVCCTRSTQLFVAADRLRLPGWVTLTCGRGRRQVLRQLQIKPGLSMRLVSADAGQANPGRQGTTPCSSSPKNGSLRCPTVPVWGTKARRLARSGGLDR
jgi:hypothetical protein